LEKTPEHLNYITKYDTYLQTPISTKFNNINPLINLQPSKQKTNQATLKLNIKIESHAQ